jgi:hypothetical protein
MEDGRLMGCMKVQRMKEGRTEGLDSMLEVLTGRDVSLVEVSGQ